MENKHPRRGCTQVNGVGQALPDVTNCQVKPDLHKQQSGFTLIELLVVVLIIGILAAVAVPQYQKAVTKTKASHLETMLSGIVSSVERYYLENGSYPTSFEQMDIELETPFTGHRYYDATCWVSLLPATIKRGDGFEVAIHKTDPNPSTGLFQYDVAAYFTTGKYKCMGFVHYFSTRGDTSLHHKTFCTGAHAENCGGHCADEFCEQIMKKKYKKYHELMGLYE